MRLHSAPKSREPDLVFIGNAYLDRVHENHVDSPVDLVVEIVSPESVARDRGEKFIEYEAEGIPEYWLIDPIRRRAEFYQLDGEGRYQQISPADGVYRSRILIGFGLKVSWLWQSPLPRLAQVLRETSVE
jgi:Uma2 family endonuclease